jgi:hypothetical protein
MYAFGYCLTCTTNSCRLGHALTDIWRKERDKSSLSPAPLRANLPERLSAGEWSCPSARLTAGPVQTQHIGQEDRATKIGRIFDVWAIVCFGQSWAKWLGYFFNRKKLLISFDEKNLFGYILGDFFHSSPGRTARRSRTHSSHLPEPCPNMCDAENACGGGACRGGACRVARAGKGGKGKFLKDLSSSV